MTMRKNKWKLAATVAVPLIGGTIVGTLANSSSKSKYKKLKTPKFAPPSWVFPIAWTSLYTTMGIAKYQFDQVPKTHNTQMRSNLAYNAQLGFNFMWSFLFFKWNLRGTALVDAMLLWITVILSTYYFYKKSKLAGSLMLPYIGWTTYAVALNYTTWKINRDNQGK